MPWRDDQRGPKRGDAVEFAMIAALALVTVLSVGAALGGAWMALNG